MTEWRSPGDDGPDEAAFGAPDEADGGPERPRPPRARHRRQTPLLILAAALVAATVVLLLVVLLTGGSDGPAKGSPEAAVDTFAGALRSGVSAQVAALSCTSARSAVLAGARPVLGSVTSAHRAGSATVSAGLAQARLVLSARGKNDEGTLALKKESGAWCVVGFVTNPAP